MNGSGIAHVLIVADKTAATGQLIEAVRNRAAQGSVRFHLLIPNPKLASWHPSEVQHPVLTQGEQVLALALPLLQDASACVVEGEVSVRHDPMDAVEEALLSHRFDEIIVSTLPHQVSLWLHVDLPRRIAAVSGLPVTTVVAGRDS